MGEPNKKRKRGRKPKTPVPDKTTLDPQAQLPTNTTRNEAVSVPSTETIDAGPELSRRGKMGQRPDDPEPNAVASPERRSSRYGDQEASAAIGAKSPEPEPIQNQKTPTPTIPPLWEPTQDPKTLTWPCTIPGVTTSASSTASFQLPRHVLLLDWWLEKAEGKRLAVGGFPSRERLGIRVFRSSAISKRHNVTTLETMDGITVEIRGHINRSRTYQNGFPFEVCNHFSVGFPNDWEKYCGEESTSRGIRTRIPGLFKSSMFSARHTNDFQSVSLNNIPVTRGRDLLISLGDTDLIMSMFDGILEQFSGNAFKKTVHSVRDKAPTDQKKSEVKNGHREDVDTLDATDMTMEDIQKSSKASKTDLNALSPRAGIATRSMTRLNHLKNKLDENRSSNPSVKQKVGGENVKPEANRKESKSMVTSPRTPRKNRATKSSGQDEFFKENPDSSAVRRSSSRLKNMKK